MLSSRLHSEGLRVVDCRFDLADPSAGRRQYLAGHIPGAVYADLDVDLAAPADDTTGRHPLPETTTIVDTLSRLGIDTDTDVVVYDAGSGAFAARLWWMLRWLGHDRAAVLDGGLSAWQNAGFPVETGTRSVAEKAFIATERPELVLALDELLENGSTADGLNLLDARDAARYRGEVEPIDPVSGHIPGALNLPFTRALHDDGRWKSRDELKRLWSELLGEDTETPSAVMCGSGVTACHLVVSAILAGYSEPRVYVGSWSEWIRDPNRPVATGGG